MTIDDALDRIRTDGIDIQVDGTELTITGALDADDPLLHIIRQNKPEFVRLFKTYSDPTFNMGQPSRIGVWYTVPMRPNVKYLAAWLHYPMILGMTSKADWLLRIANADDDDLWLMLTALKQRHNLKYTRPTERTPTDEIQNTDPATV